MTWITPQNVISTLDYLENRVLIEGSDPPKYLWGTQEINGTEEACELQARLLGEMTERDLLIFNLANYYLAAAHLVKQPELTPKEKQICTLVNQALLALGFTPLETRSA